MTPTRPGRTRPRAARSGFTLVEMLVTVVVIALLVGILGAVLAGAFRTGRKAATEQQLAGIGFALEQFKNDFGYYPPLVNDDAASFDADSSERFTLVDGLNDQGTLDQMEYYEARWHSMFSLPVYLVGVGEIAPLDFQPENEARHDGVAGPGFRDPGPDKAWGGARARTFDGEYRSHRPPVQGRTYGPYLEVADEERFFREVKGEDFRRFDVDTAARATWNEEQRDPMLRRQVFVFVDQWDQPIRYYRDWPTRDAVDPANPKAPCAASLERVPVELLGVETISAWPSGERLDVDEEREILSAPFALLSAGPDGKVADAAFVSQVDISGNLMDDQFRNFEKVDAMSNGDRDTLVKSLRDNVRFTP